MKDKFKTHLITSPDQTIPIKISKFGPGSINAITIIELFENAQKKHFSRSALWTQAKNKTWKSISWNKYFDFVFRFARSLIANNVERYAGVAIQGFNSSNWLIAHLGTIFAGAISVGIYPTSEKEVCEYIVRKSNIEVIIIENVKQLEKYRNINCDSIKCFVIWDNDRIKDFPKPVYIWDEFMKMGNNKHNEILCKRMKSQKPENVCAYIFTSGTTGMPKGVMLSHDNITWTAKVVTNMINMNQKDQIVSFLPLSDIATMIVDIYGPMCAGAQVSFAKPYALIGSLIETLNDVRPTIFLGVPRVWEKIEEKMRDLGKNTSCVKKWITSVAKDIGSNANEALQSGGQMPFGYSIASSLVFSKEKDKIGLGRCKLMLTCAAPISKSTLDYFASLDMTICELFGMSECTGHATISLPQNHEFTK
jgi:long-chain-fatty-acid--CoA ligase ACSBG